MKKTMISMCALLISTGMASAVNLTCAANAKIKKAIIATQTAPMDFGTIVPAVAATPVTLSTAAVRTTGGLDAYGTSVAGEFTVNAEPSTAMTIAFANTTLTSGANNMALDTFTHSSVPAADTTSATGLLTVKVGANLNVGANQVSGTYAGNYAVTISY